MSSLMTGINKEEYNKAASTTVTAAFEATPSQIIDGKIKGIVIYKNKFGGEVLNVNFTYELEGKDKEISYRSDIGKNMAPTEEQKKNNEPGALNQGFLSRVKSLLVSTNKNEEDLSDGKEIEIKDNYGNTCKGVEILGLNDLGVKLMLRLSVNTNMPEGESYRETNDIEGVVSCEQDAIDFQEKIDKNKGLFNYKGYWKGAAKKEKSAGASKEQKKEAKEVSFA